MDWDKLRIFQAAADAGSFTHAGAALGLSQSAISRQVSALEIDLDVPLFHRHARGLLLTEQGELLLRTVRDVMLKLDAVKSHLSDSREKPNGDLRVTTTVGIGSNWLVPRLAEFLELYPDIRLQIILSDDELDLGMREADVAVRMREPVQPDLIRRRLFTMHRHIYAAPAYLEANGEPKSVADLDFHRIVTYGGAGTAAGPNLLQTIGRDARHPRQAALQVDDINAIARAVRAGLGISILPDYIVAPDSGLVRLLPEAEIPEIECYFVYPEEMRSVARVQVFRDFLVGNAQRWTH